MISIQISDVIAQPDTFDLIELQALERTAWHTLQYASPGAEVDASLVLTNNEEIQGLNRSFLGVDAPTDVLSFSSGEVDPDTGIFYLGDVIISLEKARSQAEEGGHSLAAELQLLTVHGLLHLLGHDHARKEEKEQMWAAQAEILRQLGSPISAPDHH
jgi:probable rRNA maturation factor